MSGKIENTTGGGALDTAKLLAALLIALGGIVAFYWFGQLPTYQRFAMVLAGMVAGAALAYTSGPGRAFWTFVDGSRVELRKVIWPTREETVQTTLYLAVFVMILGAVMLCIDWVLAYLVGRLVGTGA